MVVTVNPTPQLTSTLTPSAICSGTSFGYTPTSSTSGATYAWTRAAITSINGNTGGSGSGAVSEVLTNSSTSPVNAVSYTHLDVYKRQGTGNPSEVLTNTTADPVDVTYVYTVSANGCTNGTTYNVVVSVKPTPQLTSTLSPSSICSGSTFSYTPTSSTSGASYAWSRAAVAGISNTAATGSGNPNETLTNTTTAPINVTYVYTVSAVSYTHLDVYKRQVW